MARKIIVTVFDGKMEVEAKGFSGVGCEETINKLLEAARLTPTNTEYKDEYYKVREANALEVDFDFIWVAVIFSVITIPAILYWGSKEKAPYFY